MPDVQRSVGVSVSVFTCMLSQSIDLMHFSNEEVLRLLNFVFKLPVHNRSGNVSHCVGGHLLLANTLRPHCIKYLTSFIA